MMRTFERLTGPLGLLFGVGFTASVWAASSTSLVIGVGGVIPVGPWASRWKLGQSSDAQVRYQFAPGAGVTFSAGTYTLFWDERSPQAIAAETTIRDIPPEFQPYAQILQAEERGTFHNIPLGVGLYYEGLLGGWRAYSSVGMVVNLWKFKRQLNFQERVITPLNDTNTYRDEWEDSQDGAKMGFQIGTGLLYPLRKTLFLDLSLNFLYSDIGNKYGAILRYGKPARTWNPQRYKDYKGEISTLGIKLGLRYWL